MKDLDKIKKEWQEHNRDNGLTWNEVAELFNQIESLIEEKWISVDDGLPEDNETVIGYEDEVGEPFPCEYDDGSWFDLESQVFIPPHQTVTYWQPLPEPPKQ